MPNVVVTSDRYTVDDPLYQWDTNKVLEIRGLSLPSVPEIHFTNSAMDAAIVRQANMDSAGVITVDVPDTILQKPYTLTVYVCIYQGDNYETFETLYEIKIPVKPRNKPNDYSFEGTMREIYSFNALHNEINHKIYTAREVYNETLIARNEAQASANAAAETLENALAEAEEMIPNLVNTFSAANNVAGYRVITLTSPVTRSFRDIVVPAKHCCIGNILLENSIVGQDSILIYEKLYITGNEGVTYSQSHMDADGRLVMSYVLVNDSDEEKKFFNWLQIAATPQSMNNMIKPIISEIFIPCTSK